MKLVKARKEDIPTIRKIAEKSWRENYDGILSEGQISYMLELMYSEEALQKDFENPHYHYYLISSEEEPHIGIMGFENHTEPFTTKLHRIYLLKSAKGKGVGKFAINSLKNMAAEAGDNRIILNVNKHNPALNFYQTQGFTIDDEGVFDIGNGYVMDDFLMETFVQR